MSAQTQTPEEDYPVFTGYMCECCWNSRSMYERDEAYNKSMREHEASGCACTKPGLEGARRRAGQWWDEAAQEDERLLRSRSGGARGKVDGDAG